MTGRKTEVQKLRHTIESLRTSLRIKAANSRDAERKLWQLQAEYDKAFKELWALKNNAAPRVAQKECDALTNIANTNLAELKTLRSEKALQIAAAQATLEENARLLRELSAANEKVSNLTARNANLRQAVGAFFETGLLPTFAKEKPIV